MVKNLPANAGNTVQSLGQEDSPRGGNGSPLQYYCLENPMDRGAWRATVDRVAKSQTQLSNFHFLFNKKTYQGFIYFVKSICKYFFHLYLFSCPTLCHPMDCSLPGSSVDEIFQAIVLEWIAISFSRGSSQPRDRTRVSCIGRQILYH